MDFHFVPDPKQNLEHIMNCWEQRKRTYKEKWLLLYEHYFTIQDVLTSLKNATMDFDDDFIIGINKTSLNHVELWELYRIGNGSPIQHINLGIWNSNSGLQLTKSKKWHRRRDLKGHHFKTTALVESPFISKLELNPSTGKYDVVGSFVDLLDLYAKTMNFTYTLEPPPDNSWGGLQPDGSWNGMMYLVDNQIVDIGKYSLLIC